jgi:hypothetical protein
MIKCAVLLLPKIPNLEKRKRREFSPITETKNWLNFPRTRKVFFPNLGHDAITMKDLSRGFHSPCKHAGVVTPLRHDRFIHVLSDEFIDQTFYHSTDTTDRVIKLFTVNRTGW